MSMVNSFVDFVFSRSSQILDLIVEHIGLTSIAVIIAIIIGIPLGILITRVNKLSVPILGFANLIQAVPSLALLGFLIPVFGIGSKPAITMVFLYSLLPIVKNTYTGLININPDIIEASRGMGMTKGQILRMVQIPLALPIIMTGIRISAVTAVGLMTIAAFIGAGGLGYMVFSGVQTVNNNMVLAGAIPACLLALTIDFIVGKIEKGVTPPGIRKADGTIKLQKRKKKSFGLVKKAIALCLAAVLVATGVLFFTRENDKIVIGSKNFNEQLILGNMLATLIEKNTDIKVDRKLNLGGTSIAFNALKAGELDIYVEYTGTALVDIMGQPPINDSDKVYDMASDYFNKNYNITWLMPLGFNNTYTLAVRKDTAQKYNLKSFSDLAKISDQLVLGCTIEFSNREDGYLGLKKNYNMNFKDISTVDGGLRYTSLNSNNTDVIDAFSTDGLIKAFDLKVLKDDKNFFPPYHAAPIISNKTLEKNPELKDLINKLAGKLDDEKMRELNYKVDKLNEDPAKVAEDYLRENGLIN
ncbi:carnitine transport binding protein OpuCC precursor [Oxobacter pfennigii]|uniref:Carnitine transport binding protein OpuCC n=1 Tax=Oxobacter pfennigii TaxID=36849 RepID=A0A0P9AGD7_9CLOT|nr:glycine betaine ABC transporter substrate-binding protein [Oxobacter pfennigii]KPU44485.1 carnitine transport binding protein OpuCC precursor [Oxobacter pfennigii]